MSRRRRRAIVTLVIGVAIIFAACKRHRNRQTPAAAETSGVTAASVISAADPRAVAQFVRGFYGIEGNSWRWTDKTFAVSLSPPRGAAQKGAQLVLHFSNPDDALRKRPAVTLSATAGGLKLAPETYTQSGPLTYTRDIPADRLTGATVLVEFSLDQALPPNPPDARELGIIVSEVGLQIK